MKKESLIYAHHHGQFFDPDTNSKVAVKLGQRLFMEVIHDVSLKIWLVEKVCSYKPFSGYVFISSYGRAFWALQFQRVVQQWV